MRGYRAFLLSRLAYQTPMVLVCFVAFVLSLVYIRRAVVPCLLTLAGVAIHFHSR